MFKEQMNKIKALIIKNTKEDNGNSKKKIENLVFFLIILIITIIIINVILKGDKKETKQEDDSLYKELAKASTFTNVNEKKSDDELEKRLQDILETMTGVRKNKSFSYIFKIKRSSSNV